MVSTNDDKFLEELTNSDNINFIPKYTYFFEKERLYETLVKILFLPLHEKIDIKEVKNKYQNDIDEYIRKNFVVKGAIYDNLVNEEDYYREQLISFKDSDYKPFNKQNITIFFSENICKLEESIGKEFSDNVNSLKENFAKIKLNNLNGDDEDNSFDLICLELLSKSISFFKSNLNGENIFSKQVYVYKCGFFHEILSLLRFCYSNLFLKNILIQNGSFDLLISRVLELIQSFSDDNPFLLSLSFNKPIINLFFCKKSKKDNNITLKDFQLSFYLKALKVMKKYNYLLELDYLIDTVKSGIKKVNLAYIVNKRVHKHYVSDIKNLLSLLDSQYEQDKRCYYR